MNEKNLCSQIQEFLSSVPSVIDVIGYGSGVKEQKNYDTSFQKNIDIIATVDDDILWHQENLQLHKDFYSKLAHITTLPLKHYGTDINYLAQLEYKSNLFKLGIIRKDDLIDDLTNWKNFYLAGRLQKSVLEVQVDLILKNAIDLNRKNALIIALILNYYKPITEYELLYSICNLSFKKDIRMTFQMENPHKVRNILEGSYNELVDIYNTLNKDIFVKNNNKIIPNYELILEEFHNLPKYLLEYLEKNNIDINNLELNDLKYIRELIISFLSKTNHKASTIQPIKSILLNPLEKSTYYAFQKHMKYKGK